MEDSNPIVIRCKSCGAPLRFDIVKQNYHCLSCGAEMEKAEVAQVQQAWQSSQQMKVSSQASVAGEVFYTCGSCGAEVMMRDEAAVSQCAFCGGSLVRRAFAKEDSLPWLITPFYLTRAEGLAQLDSWCAQQSKRPEAKLIQAQREQLTGYYLPYELVRGAVSASSHRDESTRAYHLRSYLEGIAVNTSSQMNNLLLDAAEPFDFTHTRAFDFSVLSGFKVKLQDIDETALRTRVAEEVETDLKSYLKPLFCSEKLFLELSPEELEVLPVALPFYYLKCSETVEVAINGQTGRVAVSKQEVKKSYRYLREPLWITLVGSAALIGSIAWFSDWETAITFGGMGSIFVALFSFAAFTGKHGAPLEDPILQDDRVQANRSSTGVLTVSPSQQEKQRAEPVFLEKLRSGLAPVSLRFFSVWRIVKWVLQLLLLNLPPALVAYCLTGFHWEAMDFRGLFVWWVVSIPVSFAYILKLSRVAVYDMPLLYRYPYTGQRIDKREYSNKQAYRTNFGPKKEHNSRRTTFWLCCALIAMFVVSSLATAGLFGQLD